MTKKQTADEQLPNTLCAGMARVALRVVRHDRFDDPIKVYSDVKDPVQRFTESVFGQAEHELEHTIIIPPSIISDALLEGPRASPGVVARVARRLLEIEKKVDGSPADRMALMYMVGIFLFHNLIQQGRRERLVTEIQFDCDDAMLLGIPGPELGPEFESDDEILNLIAEIPPQQEYHQEQEQRRYEDLEADAAVPHRRALLLGVESIVKAEMRTEAVLKNQAPAVKPSTAKTLFAILAQTQLTGSSDFDWLRAQASVCLSDEA